MKKLAENYTRFIETTKDMINIKSYRFGISVG